MKSIRFIIPVLFGNSVFAQSFDDGLYELSDRETPEYIIAEDGERYWVSERLEAALDEHSVVALDNSNERFQVTLRYPSDSLPDVSVANLLSSDEEVSSFPRLALVIDNLRFVSAMSGGGNGQASVLFYLTGAENAERVAEYFGTEVRYRYHPGYRLRVRFSPQEQTVKLGSRVPVILEITNVGAESLVFRYSQNLAFRFSGTRRPGETVQTKRWPLRANEISTLPTVRPGETHRIEADAANWLEFDRVSVYDVFGSYRMEFFEGGSLAIWSEYVSDGFKVTVEP